MGRKHHKKKYLSVTDRPIFKILSSLLMVIIFALLYYLMVIVVKRPGLALTCSVPCVLLLVWVAIKQLWYWWIWIAVACPCIVLMILYRQPPLSFILETTYWGMSLAMCLWLILAPSRARSRAIKRKKSRSQNHHHSDEPSASRPKDEFLEKLFAEHESE